MAAHCQADNLNPKGTRQGDTGLSHSLSVSCENDREDKQATCPAKEQADVPRRRLPGRSRLPRARSSVRSEAVPRAERDVQGRVRRGRGHGPLGPFRPTWVSAVLRPRKVTFVWGGVTETACSSLASWAAPASTHWARNPASRCVSSEQPLSCPGGALSTGQLHYGPRLDVSFLGGQCNTLSTRQSLKQISQR